MDTIIGWLEMTDLNGKHHNRIEMDYSINYAPNMMKYCGSYKQAGYEIKTKKRYILL